MFSRLKERNAKTSKDYKCVEKNPCQSEEGALAWISNFVWASGSEREEICGSRKKISEGKRGAKRRMSLLIAGDSTELEKVDSGSATQGLWLGDRKVGSRIVDEDRSQLPGRGTVGKVRRGGR